MRASSLDTVDLSLSIALAISLTPFPCLRRHMTSLRSSMVRWLYRPMAAP